MAACPNAEVRVRPALRDMLLCRAGRVLRASRSWRGRRRRMPRNVPMGGDVPLSDSAGRDVRAERHGDGR